MREREIVTNRVEGKPPTQQLLVVAPHNRTVKNERVT